MLSPICSRGQYKTFKHLDENVQTPLYAMMQDMHTMHKSLKTISTKIYACTLLWLIE